MKMLSGIFFMVLALFMAVDASACTTFTLQEGNSNIFGRNYDWSVGDGAVIANKRGLKKTAMKARDETGTPATWKAKYGSITFNQYGREFPQGGMNEAGLVVEILAVPEGQFPAVDARPYVGKAQYRQYLLDMFATVQEVIDGDSLIRVSAAGKGPMTHLYLSDRTGASAVIEFIGGKRVVYTGATLPVRALSNSSYADSLASWQARKIPAEDKWKSVERFFGAADAAGTFADKGVKSPVDYAFGTLDRVAQGEKTKWSIVYDIYKRQLFYRTAANTKVREISLKDVDFACKSPVALMDIDTGSGDVTRGLQPYTQQANRKLIADAFGKTDFLKGIPAQIIDAIAAYPESAKCEL